MSDLRFSFPACVIAGKGRITPEDVGLLRRHLWPEGIRSRQEAVMALALQERCDSHCPEWAIYLVESVTEFVVWRASPTGEVSNETAGWLLEWLTDAGTVWSPVGFDILLHVLDVARSVPSFLSATVLNQVRLALLPIPRGAYARRRTGGHAVSKHDLALVWRVLRSGLDRGTVNLSRAERQILHEIDQLAAPHAHHPGWREMMRLARPETATGDILQVENWSDPARAERGKNRAA